MSEELLEDEFSEEEILKLDMMYDEVNELLINDFLQEYIAFYIYCLHKYKFLEAQTTSLRCYVNSAIDAFNNVSYKDVDFAKVEKKLEEKYNLKLIQSEPYLELKEI